jgi:hypothetical protein
MSGLYVEQAQSPAGYQVRVYSGQPAAQDIRIGAEGGALVVRRVSAGWGGQQAGWMTQWVALPADANLAAMRMRRGNGVLEIFIPRFG